MSICQRNKCEEQIKYLIDLRQRFRQVDKSILIQNILYSIVVFKRKFKYNLVFRCSSEKKKRKDFLINFLSLVELFSARL